MVEFHQDSFVADWQSGRFHRPAATLRPQNGRVITLVLAGDWAPGIEQQQALLSNPERFYGNIVPVFASAELSVVNVEKPVSGDGTPAIKDGPNLSVGAEALVAGLAALGVSIVCLANNHIMDYGELGLYATLEALNASGIEAIGAGKDQDEAIQPAIADLGSCRIGLLNIAEGEEARASDRSPGAASLEKPWVCHRTKELAEVVDVVIVIVHAGREYIPVPPPYIRAAYRALADAGASLVVGHHPHVPQGLELWNGVPIIYSLGNFVFRPSSGLPYRNTGYLLKIEVLGTDLAAFEVKPYEIKDNGPVLLDGARRANFLAELEQISQYIASPFLEELWEAYADLFWQLRLPRELASFAELISCQDWAKAVAHRIAMGVDDSRGLRRFMLRAMHRGVRATVRHLPSQREVDPRLAAALRNRFDTPAHSQLYEAALVRAMEGTIGESPPWTKALLERWEVLS